MIAPPQLSRHHMSLSVISICIALAACGGSDDPADQTASATESTRSTTSSALQQTVAITGTQPFVSGAATAPLPSAAAGLLQASLPATTAQAAAPANATAAAGAPAAATSASDTRSAIGALPPGEALAVAPTLAVQPGSALSLWKLPETVAVEGDVSGATSTASTADALAKRTEFVMSTNRVPKEDWAAARSKIAADPTWASWVERRKAALDDWMKVTRDRADLIGGYMHDYNDPKTGMPLTWTTESPEPPEGSTDTEIRFKQAWVYYLRSYNLTRTGEAARIYALTGDVKYADWAVRQLDLYATNYNLWPLRTENGRARMYRHGLDEATGIWDLLDAARLLEGYAGATRASTWRSGLFQPMAENLKTVTSPLTNIGLWQASGIAGIAMRLHDAALLDYALNNPIGIRATLAAGMTTDYLWDEGSFGYNDYVISALSRVQVTAGIEGYAPTVAPERTPLYRLLLSPFDYRFDDGTLPTPGDSTPYNAFTSRSYVRAYRAVPTWWGLQQTNTTQSWEALLDSPGATPATPALPPVTTRNFPGTRMAVLRSGAWQAFVHYGQARQNHWQEEALTYEVYNAATRISGDPGTVNYSSPYHVDYFRKAPAQNVPLIDGLGQENWNPGEIESFVPAEARLVVKHAAYRSGVSVTRGYRTTSQGFTERTLLQVQDGTAKRLGMVFHSDCSLTPLSGLKPNPTATPVPATPSTAYWGAISAYSAAANWSIELDCKGKKFAYTVTGPVKQTVFFATEPTTPLPTTRSLVYYDVTAATAQFKSTLISR